MLIDLVLAENICSLILSIHSQTCCCEHVRHAAAANLTHEITPVSQIYTGGAGEGGGSLKACYRLVFVFESSAHWPLMQHQQCWGVVNYK